MHNKEATRFRARIIPETRGATLEVGIGSGLNLPFYGGQIERLVAVDPSEEFLRMAMTRARRAAIPIKFIRHTGEALPIADASIRRGPKREHQRENGRP